MRTGSPASQRRSNIRVLTFHNTYRVPGGEDRVFEDEAALLESRGHAVLRVQTGNAELSRGGVHNAAAAFWNHGVYRRLKDAAGSFRPDIVHIHNDFPLASPAVFHAARTAGAAVVHTLHNFRALCVNGLMHRAGSPCSDCMDQRSLAPALRHGCYRSSRCATAVAAARQVAHKRLATWDRNVDQMIAPSRFVLDKHLASGVSPDRIALKPHFVPGDPRPGDGAGGNALFVGRLMADKGLQTLLDAWRQHDGGQTLKIVGAGPMQVQVQQAAAADPRIKFVGPCPPDQVGRHMADASCLIAPSLVFESFGRVVIEAFAHGTPAIVTGHGALAELIEEGKTGWRVTPDDAPGLSQAIGRALADRPAAQAMRRRCRAVYEQRYTAQANYEQLTAVYRKAIAAARLARRLTA